MSKIDFHRSDFVKIDTTVGATLDSLYQMKNDLKSAEQVLHTNPLLLRRY